MKALANGWRERVDKGVTIPYAFPCQLKLPHPNLLKLGLRHGLQQKLLPESFQTRAALRPPVQTATQIVPNLGCVTVSS